MREDGFDKTCSIEGYKVGSLRVDVAILRGVKKTLGNSMDEVRDLDIMMGT